MIAGDRIGASVARIHTATLGLWTDKQAVWESLTGLFADERAMVAQVYLQIYNVSLYLALGAAFSDSSIFGNNLQKTILIFQHGGLTVGQRIFFAVQGWGTDIVAVRAAVAELRNLPPGQIEQADAEYQTLSGGETLYNGLRSDLSGRDWFQAEQALLGSSDDPVVQA